MGISGRNIFEDRMLIDYRLPSPVSVLQHSFFAESCNSWETIDSNNCLGGNRCGFTISNVVTYCFLIKPTN